MTAVDIQLILRIYPSPVFLGGGIEGISSGVKGRFLCMDLAAWLLVVLAASNVLIHADTRKSNTANTSINLSYRFSLSPNVSKPKLCDAHFLELELFRPSKLFVFGLWFGNIEQWCLVKPFSSHRGYVGWQTRPHQFLFLFEVRAHGIIRGHEASNKELIDDYRLIL